MDGLDVSLKLPDIWQQAAIRALQKGHDVVVDAPTGAGKTYIFELFLRQARLGGQAIFTVPTRALANDKRMEWARDGWDVGIVTGDLSENADAPVVVATLETQKNRLLRGRGPRLLVIDEYQMLADPERGVNYELAVALAPEHTQLLLLSGSVANPESVVDWLKGLGRTAALVSHRDRPVPQEEVFLEAIRERPPDSVRGTWPRSIARALMAGFGPILAFAPRRRAAERLAMQLAAAFPQDDPLVLSPEQQKLAGHPLKRLLRNRIAFHHSGLSYPQRAGLIEPLAKAGQLRVVVATTGLAAGINFSLRSVLVTDREYRAGDHHHLLRPDELLQMFGRAGRRGLDDIGYILTAQNLPRMREARPLVLKRTNKIEWPSIVAVMQAAVDQENDPIGAARSLASRLFSRQQVRLGLGNLLSERRIRTRPPGAQSPRREPMPAERRTITEIQALDGSWERKRAPVRVAMGDTVARYRERWVSALTRADLVSSRCRVGTVWKYHEEERGVRYGREIPLARISDGKDDREELVLHRWLARALRDLQEGRRGGVERIRRRWTLDRLEAEVIPLLPQLSGGGMFRDLVDVGNEISARVEYSRAAVYAVRDNAGNLLLDPPERQVFPDDDLSFLEAMGGHRGHRPQTAAEAWFELGLIDGRGHPTRRGIIFSFFNHGEGLAIAAALEDPNYPVDEIVRDLANLRAGHRFAPFEEFSGRLGNLCRFVYRGASYPGYLNCGVPPDYGDGAAEILEKLDAGAGIVDRFVGDELHAGDIERAALEWRSVLNHVASAPRYDWDRWRELQAAARDRIGASVRGSLYDRLPELTYQQTTRYICALRFGGRPAPEHRRAAG